MRSNGRGEIGIHVPLCTPVHRSVPLSVRSVRPSVRPDIRPAICCHESLLFFTTQHRQAASANWSRVGGTSSLTRLPSPPPWGLLRMGCKTPWTDLDGRKRRDLPCGGAPAAASSLRLRAHGPPASGPPPPPSAFGLMALRLRVRHLLATSPLRLWAHGPPALGPPLHEAWHWVHVLLACWPEQKWQLLKLF